MPKSHGYYDEQQVERRQIIGRRIEASRTLMGLSKQGFASLIGVSGGTYTGWIKGRHGMTSENFSRLVAITGEPASFFNPESLAKRDSIEGLSRQLGTILGKSRMQRLLQVPEARLKREVDAVVGHYIVDQDEAQSGY